MWRARLQTHADKGMYTSPHTHRPFNKQHKNITFYTLTHSVMHITRLRNVSGHVYRVCLCVDDMHFMTEDAWRFIIFIILVLLTILEKSFISTCKVS